MIEYTKGATMSEEKTEQQIEEKIEAVVEKTEDRMEQAEEQTEEQTEEKTEGKTEEKTKKTDLAKEKIEKAKILTADTRAQIEECMKNIDKDIEKLTAQKQALFESALHPSEKLLEDLKMETELLDTLPDNGVELLDLDEDQVEIKELSSGRIKGCFFALLAGVLTFMGWALASSRALGLSIPPEKIPDLPRLNTMLEWTSQQLGQGSSAKLGAAAVIIAVVLIMWIVYAVIVSLRASHNLRVANETEEAVTLYCTTKEECKEKMKLVREHIQNSTRTLAKYKVLLEEQNAKIRRAVFLEEAEAYDGLHANTKAELAVTKQLVAEAKQLMEVPISEAGVLTTEAKDALQKINRSLNEYIMKLYS